MGPQINALQLMQKMAQEFSAALLSGVGAVTDMNLRTVCRRLQRSTILSTCQENVSSSSSNAFIFIIIIIRTSLVSGRCCCSDRQRTRLIGRRVECERMKDCRLPRSHSFTFVHSSVRSCHAHSARLFRPRRPCSYLAKSRAQRGCLAVTSSPPDSALTR